jgi:uncharacterized membrane protein YuzA (DUF378 family)
MYAWKTLEYVTLILIIVGALNWGLVGFFKLDLVAKIFGGQTTAFGARVIYILVGLSALVHVFSRNYYLPFLGDAAFPCGPLTPKEPLGADAQVVVSVAPSANVVYWASSSTPENDGDAAVASNPWVAYGQYTNAGVARADASGKAVLRVRRPIQYKVPPLGRTLSAHVHYRVCADKGGMLGPVRTAYIDA